MTDFRFPETNAHCVIVNGWNLIFSSGVAAPMSANQAGFDFVQHCSGLSIEESQIWLRERYGEASVHIARDFRMLIEAGYFTEPDLDFAEYESTIPPITSFGICITRKCNMQCRYCFATHMRRTDRSMNISLDSARAALDFLFDALQPPHMQIQLGITGEAQLEWGLAEELMNYARNKADESGASVNFVVDTNGLEINPEFLDYLRTHNDMIISLSWDGPPDIHNLQRLKPDGTGTYKSVSSAFQILQESSDYVLPVIATLSALNPDAGSIFNHLFNNGVRDLVINPIRSSDPAIAITQESVSAFKTGYANLAELLLKRDHAQIERLFTIMKDGDHLGRHLIRIIKGTRLGNRCFAARSYFDVDIDGEIYPCPSFIGVKAFRMGSVHNGLDEHRVKSFREDTFISNLEACQNCWAKYLCGGPCAYISNLSTGSANIPYEPNCELTKCLIELAGYIVARLKCERPGLLEHVLTLRDAVPTGGPAAASCNRAPEGGLWTRPVDEWRTADPIVLDSMRYIGGFKQWRGVSDHSAEIHLQWDDEYLYVLAEVQDDKHVPPAGPEDEWWFYDSIQLGLDPVRGGKESIYPWKLPEGVYEYGVAETAGEASVYSCHINPLRPCRDGRALITREGNTTDYQVAIPWKQMTGFTASAGAECGFSVVVNDCDSGARGWLQWTHGLAIRKAPARFGVIRLIA